MPPQYAPPPQPILQVLDVAVDALLGGSYGWLHIPKNGVMNVTWQPKLKCYRVTLDVTIGHELDPEAMAFVEETRKKIEAFS